MRSGRVIPELVWLNEKVIKKKTMAGVRGEGTKGELGGGNKFCWERKAKKKNQKSRHRKPLQESVCRKNPRRKDPKQQK